MNTELEYFLVEILRNFHLLTDWSFHFQSQNMLFTYNNVRYNVVFEYRTPGDGKPVYEYRFEHKTPYTEIFIYTDNGKINGETAVRFDNVETAIKHIFGTCTIPFI